MMLGDKWWHNSDMETTNQTVFKFEPENNIVKLFDDSIWAQYDLSWKDKPKNLLT